MYKIYIHLRSAAVFANFDLFDYAFRFSFFLFRIGHILNKNAAIYKMHIQPLILAVSYTDANYDH